jgi:hypothetical protein
MYAVKQARAIGFAALMLVGWLPVASVVDARGDERHQGGSVRGRRESGATIAARQLFFGPENVNAETGRVDRDKVIFSWLTNTTYAVAVKDGCFCSIRSSPASR